jgi:hypothetical protein
MFVLCGEKKDSKKDVLVAPSVIYSFSHKQFLYSLLVASQSHQSNRHTHTNDTKIRQHEKKAPMAESESESESKSNKRKRREVESDNSEEELSDNDSDVVSAIATVESRRYEEEEEEEEEEKEREHTEEFSDEDSEVSNFTPTNRMTLDISFLSIKEDDEGDVVSKAERGGIDGEEEKEEPPAHPPVVETLSMDLDLVSQEEEVDEEEEKEESPKGSVLQPLVYHHVRAVEGTSISFLSMKEDDEEDVVSKAECGGIDGEEEKEEPPALSPVVETLSMDLDLVSQEEEVDEEEEKEESPKGSVLQPLVYHHVRAVEGMSMAEMTMDLDSLAAVACGRVNDLLEKLSETNGTATIISKLERGNNQDSSRINLRTSPEHGFNPTTFSKTVKSVNLGRVKNIDLFTCTLGKDNIPFRMTVFLPHPQKIFATNMFRDLDIMVIVIGSNMARERGLGGLDGLNHPTEQEMYLVFLETLNITHGGYGYGITKGKGSQKLVAKSNTAKSNSMKTVGHFFLCLFEEIGKIARDHDDDAIREQIKIAANLPYTHGGVDPQTVRTAAANIDANKVLVLQAVGVKRLGNMSTPRQTVDLNDTTDINEKYAENVVLLNARVEEIFNGSPMPTYNERFFMNVDIGINFYPLLPGSSFLPFLPRCRGETKRMLSELKEYGSNSHGGGTRETGTTFVYTTRHPIHAKEVSQAKSRLLTPFLIFLQSRIQFQEAKTRTMPRTMTIALLSLLLAQKAPAMMQQTKTEHPTKVRTVAAPQTNQMTKMRWTTTTPTVQAKAK